MGALSLGPVLAAALLLVTACSGDGQEKHAGGTTSPATPAAAGTTVEPVATPELDSIAVIGHSGATGTMSDPSDPIHNAYENSWATGENPEVRSIYHRLLQTHPALEGHHYNEAVNGSRVTDLADQVDELAATADADSAIDVEATMPSTGCPSRNAPGPTGGMSNRSAWP